MIVAEPTEHCDDLAYTYYWQASAFCCGPLYFEEPNLERYGYTHGILQPIISGAHFLRPSQRFPTKWSSIRLTNASIRSATTAPAIRPRASEFAIRSASTPPPSKPRWSSAFSWPHRSALLGQFLASRQHLTREIPAGSLRFGPAALRPFRRCWCHRCRVLAIGSTCKAESHILREDQVRLDCTSGRPRLSEKRRLDNLLEYLNPPQREAVTHIDGPLLILAGPGSGKTRVVTHRIARMLSHGVAGRQILALTFTNKAAEEMRRRVQPAGPRREVWIGTFHRFCARLLRQVRPASRPGRELHDLRHRRQPPALRRPLEALARRSAHVTPESIPAAISWAKNNLITADQYQPQPGNPCGRRRAAGLSGLSGPAAADRARSISTICCCTSPRCCGKMPSCAASLDARYRYILVDEYQDTNLAQYSIVRGLSIDYPNLAVTGDPGPVDLRLARRESEQHPGVRARFSDGARRAAGAELPQHAARSCRGRHLISHNPRRKKKGLFTENDEGPPCRWSTIATIGGSRSRSPADRRRRRVRQAPRRAISPFSIAPTPSAARWNWPCANRRAVSDGQWPGVLSAQRNQGRPGLLASGEQSTRRRGPARIINTPARGIGRSTIARVADYAGTRKSLARSLPRGGADRRPSQAAPPWPWLGSSRSSIACSCCTAAPVEEIIAAVLDQSGYRTALEDSDDPEDQERLANVEELLTAAREFSEQNPGGNQLEAFLEQACLVNDTDAWATSDDRVTLMTMHAAKGLEFPVVFVIAVEEGFLPHERSRESPEQLEEERRLLFVAVTAGAGRVATEHVALSRVSRPAALHGPQPVLDGIAAP